MNKYKFEPNTAYKSRSGHDIFIYAVNAPHPTHPIHGCVNGYATAWTENGKLVDSQYNPGDIMPPEPERLKLKRFVNVCSFATAVFADKKVAERYVFDDLLRTAVPCWLVEILPGEEGYE